MSKVSIASIFTTAAVVISETPNFELKFNFLERLKKPLNLRSTREKREKRKTETICSGQLRHGSNFFRDPQQ